MAEQLNIEGGVEPYDEVAKRAAAYRDLSPAQKEILRVIRDDGEIRAVEAGVIIHTHRTQAGTGRCGRHRTALACCQYAASDGLEALKRMAKRGLVRRKRELATTTWVLEAPAELTSSDANSGLESGE